MTEDQYKELCGACDRVLLAPDSSLERVAIPWLHVIREHPVFLRNYEDLFLSKNRFRKIIGERKIATRYCLSRLYRIAKTSVRQTKDWYGSEPITAGCNLVFISHLVSASHAGQQDDFYFGKVPRELLESGYKVVIVLINHTNQASADLIKKWAGNPLPRIILSDSLGMKEEKKLHVHLRKESVQLKKLAANEGGLYRKVLKRASREALSGNSQRSLRMGKQIGELVTRLKPAALITTLEGHAWERVAFSVARKNQPGIKCIGYQHAALFRLQHSIRRRLGSEYDPDFILTAGLVGKTQLESTTGLRNIPISILGSDRGIVSTVNHSISSTVLPESGQACLVIPEGVYGECNLLFEFSIECARLCPMVTFIWRLHPIISFESLVKQNSRFGNLPRNIILSKETLEEDISRSRWALYRGTTAIIKAVGSGLRPVYLKVPGEMTIDPLYELNGWRAIVETSRDFEEIIKDCITDSASAIKYCESFYLPFDAFQLTKILSGAEIS